MQWKSITRQLKRFYTILWDNIEKVKTVLLYLLIGFSIFLTYNLWTFTPNNNVLESEETVETQIPDGKQEKLSNIIQPLQVVLHYNTQHYWSYSKDQNKIYAQLQNALLVSREEVEFEEDIQSDGMDITYPTGIPVNVLKETFRFSNDNPFVNNEGNVERLRIYIDEGEWKIQFIFEAEDIEKNSNRLVYQFELSDRSSIKSLLEEMVSSENTVAVDRYELSGNGFYLPIDNMKVDAYYYTPSEVDIGLFVKGLLPPDIATRKTSDRIFYGKSKSQITYHQDADELTYINSNIQDEVPRQNAIIQSLDFINNHAGWTNTFNLYHYYDSSTNGSTNYRQKDISYRMIINGFPVMDNSIGEISLVWQNNQASEYDRSLIYLNEDFSNKEQYSKVANGSQVIQALSELSNAENITGITLGYALKPGSGSEEEHQSIGRDTYLLEPAWYYKIRPSSLWRKVEFESIEPINKGG